ncbi:MAG: hypothetical protein OXH49_08305 [Gemmatimonadetes bacterium]|nr:hypothetical protein [Gemmatimonadota bacterium]
MKKSLEQAVSVAVAAGLAACGDNGGTSAHDIDHGTYAPAGQGHGFSAERLARTAEIVLDGPIAEVFPLFNPVEEPKWAPHFQPRFIYPADRTVQQGMTFKTAGHGDEADLVWRINEFDPAAYHIQYLVYGKDRYWTITIDCREADGGQTSARVTYDFLPLEEAGVAASEASLNAMFAHDLKNWEDAINSYLGAR